MSEEMKNESVETESTNEVTGLGGEQVIEENSATENKNVEGVGDSKKENTTEDKEGQENQDSNEEGNENFGKPESYDFKDVKLPEDMQLDEAMTGKFTEYASKLNLSQKSANDIMAMAVELTEQTQKQTVETMGKLQEAKINGYKDLLNRDKEVGGANLKESIATANIAYDTFFKDEGLRELLAESGLTVHPTFIKALKTIGSQMKDDSIHSSGNQAGQSRSREDILYSSMDEK